MKHIVLMMSNYYPYFSAVGVCLGNVADVMLKENKVTVICEKFDMDEADTEICNNQRIIRIISKSTSFRKTMQIGIQDSNAIQKAGYNFLLFVFRCLEYTKCILSKNSVKYDLVNTYSQALESIHDPIDVIVPACMPFETLMAAETYKKYHSDVEVVPFLFDKFAENSTLHRTKWNKKLKMKNNLALEKLTFEASERILYAPSWEEHLHKNFECLNEKFRSVEHPLIKKIIAVDLVHYDDRRINVVYTGTVMLNSRNPEPTIKIFDAIIDQYPDLLLHFYAMGTAIGKIEDFQLKHQDYVVFHGQVPTEIAHSAVANSTMLLSIGNVDITQTPSKIFEYISCCKPIIHIAVYALDPVIDILKSYPLACCVCLESDSFEEQVRSVGSFIAQKKITEINFSDLEKIYFNAIPKYSMDFILDSN